MGLVLQSLAHKRVPPRLKRLFGNRCPLNFKGIDSLSKMHDFASDESSNSHDSYPIAFSKKQGPALSC